MLQVFGSLFFMSVCIGGENIAHVVQSNKPIISRWNFYKKIGSNFLVILPRWSLVVPPKEKFANKTLDLLSILVQTCFAILREYSSQLSFAFGIQMCVTLLEYSWSVYSRYGKCQWQNIQRSICQEGPLMKPHKLPSNCCRIKYLHAVHQHNIMELTRVGVSLSLMRIERSPFSLLRKQEQG